VKKPAVLVAAFLLAILAGACSTLKTSVDWDHNADFAKYKTWSWKDTGDIKDRVWSRRVEDVLEDTLAARGLKKVKEGSDLLGVVHARFAVNEQVNYYNAGWGYGWGWGGSMVTTVTPIPVGSMIIDLVDARTKELVWRGTASAELQTGLENEQREENLRKVLAGLFANYPPAAGK
jgi:hypothetical protein